MKSIKLLILIAFSFLPLKIQSASIDATVRIQVCGNSLVEGLEECDNSDLAGRTCQSFGYSLGTLSCRASCEFNTANCSNGWGSAGGGGSGTVSPKTTSVIFSGKAYPFARINILKDAQVSATAQAGADGNFRYELSGLTAGTYAFSFTAFDNAGRKSLLVNLPVNLLGNSATDASGIFIPPTAGLDKASLLPGEFLSVSGQAFPDSSIIVFLGETEVKRTKAGAEGNYQLALDTKGMAIGDYLLKVRAESGGSGGSAQPLSFKVFASREAMEDGRADDGVMSAPMGDINDDTKINLLDFSILAFWYDRPGAPAAIDFNNDGKVNLKDFSILAYYWTG